MLKLLIPLITVAVLASGAFGYYYIQNSRLKPSPAPAPNAQPSVTPSPVLKLSPSPQAKKETPDLCEILIKGNSDVPPLYSGVEWQEPTITEYEVPLAEGSRSMNGCLIKSLKIKFNNSSRVRSFYTSEALTKGWSNISSSDLPGESGSDTWNNNSSYLLLEILPLARPDVQVVLFYTQ